jgi:hypothetical protein
MVPLNTVLADFQQEWNLTPEESWHVFTQIIEHLYAQATGYRNVRVQPSGSQWILAAEKIVVTHVLDPQLECAWDDALQWAPRCVPGDMVQIPLGPHLLPAHWEDFTRDTVHQLLKTTERSQHKALAFSWRHTLQWATTLKVFPDHTAWIRIGPFESFLSPDHQAWPWHVGDHRLVWVDHPRIHPHQPIRLIVSESSPAFLKAWLIHHVPAFHQHWLTIARVARHPGTAALIAVRSPSRTRLKTTIAGPRWQPGAWAQHPLYQQERLSWIRMPDNRFQWPDMVAAWSKGVVLAHNPEERSATIATPWKSWVIGQRGTHAGLLARLTQYQWHFVDP